MATVEAGDNVEFEVTYKTQRPVELADLGSSFRALGRQYEEYVTRHGFDPMERNAKLYVSQVRTGSIIVRLMNMLEQGSMVLKDLDVLAGFITNLHDLIEYFRTQKPKPPKTITRNDATNLSRIVEPVAKDGGATLQINFLGPVGAVHVHPRIELSNESANAIQNNVRRFLGPTPPDPGQFEKEVLYLQQVRGDPKSKVGDRGVIERFSTKPVKIHFMTPESKAAVLDRPYPFKVAHVVDGQVSTVKGEPALYKVTNVHETLGANDTGRLRSARRPARRLLAPKRKK